MKPRGNEHYPSSGQPLRSQRFGTVVALTLANNRALFRGGRGTYKLQCVIDNTVSVQSIGVFFAIGSPDDFDRFFPAPISATTCRAEKLPVSGGHWVNMSTGGASGGAFAGTEVDLLDGEAIHFWSAQGTERLKIVKVGDLPSRDAELSDRERD